MNSYYREQARRLKALHDAELNERWSNAESRIKGTWREWVVSLITVLSVLGCIAVTAAIGYAATTGFNAQDFQKDGAFLNWSFLALFGVLVWLSYPRVRRWASLAVLGLGKRPAASVPERIDHQP